MDIDDVFDPLRVIEDILKGLLNKRAGFVVEHVSFNASPKRGLSNLATVVLRIDPEIALAPPPPERETVEGPEQDNFDAQFEDIAHNQGRDSIKDQLMQAREESLTHLLDYEDDGFLGPDDD